MADNNYEQQTDSEDDCEIYFLKPVNEYNIVDKIKEANKELFAEIGCNTNLESKSTGNILHETATVSIACSTTSTSMRKVTFAENLEDYGPESPAISPSNDKINSDMNVCEENVLLDVDLNSSSPLKKCQHTIFQTIDEEDSIILNENVAKNFEQPQSATSLSLCNNDDDGNDGDDNVDKICSEIIEMKFENSAAAKEKAATLFAEKKYHSFGDHFRQATFDCDEEEHDNKSLMNLLSASDDSGGGGNAHDVDPNTDETDSIFNGISDFDDEVNTTDDDNDNDEDDDDKLSLIVASYLPDDFERESSKSPTISKQQKCSANKNRTFFRRKTEKKKSSSASSPLPSSSSSSASLARASASAFGKRFQLRRKGYGCNSVGTVASSNNGAVTKSSSANNGQTANNGINLKLNYKTCCEYRNSLQGKLPKYTGYLSEYGLSREQLEKRQQKLQKKQRFVLEQAIESNQNCLQKMQDNERAFTSWLRNKMRFPINKTRNMFDVKIRPTERKKPLKN